MRSVFFRISVLLLAWLALVSSSAQADTCATPLWQDEFTGDRIDEDKWQLIKGDGCDQDLGGWGNNEEQWYSPENARIDDGLLQITARRGRQC